MAYLLYVQKLSIGVIKSFEQYHTTKMRFKTHVSSFKNLMFFPYYKLLHAIVTLVKVLKPF